MSINKKLLAVTITAIGLVEAGYSQIREGYLIEQFRLHSYTNTFTRGLEHSFELSGQSEKLVVNGQAIYTQDVGRKINRFGKEWTGVPYKGILKFNDEKIKVNGIDLYDIKTNLKIYSIDLNDGEIVHYIWLKIPEKMKNGEAIDVARFTKRGKNGKVLENGTLEWNLIVAPTGYEFCYVEKSIELKTKKESVSRECDVFDSSQKIVGGYLEMMIEAGLKISGGGPVKLR